MLDVVKYWFGREGGRMAGDTDESDVGVRRAVCALLLEMAHADDRFTDADKKRIIQILSNEYELSRQDADTLIAAAAEELEESTDLWQFASLINEHYSTEEKTGVVEMLWKVVYADGKLDEHEDYLIHKLSTLLRLDHKQLIDAKLKVTPKS